MKKLIALFLVAVFAFGLLAACANDSSNLPAGEIADVAPDELSGTLQFAIWDDVQLPSQRAKADAFIAMNPGVTIEITSTPFDQYHIAMHTGLRAGTAPDIFWMNTTLATIFMPTGTIQTLTPLMERDNVDLSGINPDIVRAYQYNGEQFGIPKCMDSLAMAYNRALFDYAGVPHPTSDWTWDEFRQISRDLVAGGVRYGYMNDGSERFMIAWIRSGGGAFYTEDRTASAFNSPENINTLQFLMDMHLVDGTTPSGFQNAELTAEHFFLNAHAAMGVFGSWQVSYLYEHLGADLGFVEIPIGPGGRGGVSHGLGYGTPSAGSNMEAAWGFLQFLSTAESSVKQAGVTMPVHTAVVNAWLDYFPALDLSPYIRAFDYSPTIPLALTGVNGARQVVRDVLAEIWLQQYDVPTALASGEQRMNAQIALGDE